MNIIGIDFEATDKEPLKARALEVCALGMNETEGFEHFIFTNENIPEEVVDITGITRDRINEEGKPGLDTFTKLTEKLNQYDYIVAYNKAYDETLYKEECKRFGIEPATTPWICALEDLPYPDKYKCRKLSHLTLDHGYTVDPSNLHRARGDVNLMFTLIRHYGVPTLIERSKLKTFVIKANVSYNDRELAKERSYRWQSLGDKTYTKSWVKKIKEDVLEKEKQAPFEVTILETL